jgi:hypothetical protein
MQMSDFILTWGMASRLNHPLEIKENIQNGKNFVWIRNTRGLTFHTFLHAYDLYRK